jgi:arginine decarboxylase
MPDEVEKMILSHPDIKGIVITSPNFYGVCSNIRLIAQIAHKYEKVLIVDEAHGAHLQFSTKLPESSLQSGADIAVQSAHKTLPALTQASYLHVNSNRVDIEKLKFYLSIIQTSSPSYILMSSLDIARSIMETSGAKKLDCLIGQIESFKEKFEVLGNYKFLSKRYIKNGDHDITRVVINVRNLGITGYTADKFLRKNFNIQVEMSDVCNIVCICSIGNKKEDFEIFTKALEDLLKKEKSDCENYFLDSLNFSIPKEKVSLSEAINAKIKLVDLEKSKGEVSARIITPYPPGIPLVCHGEIINDEVIQYINNVIKMGGTINGISKNNELNVLA